MHPDHGHGRRRQLQYSGRRLRAGFLRAYLGSRAAGTQQSAIVRFQRSDVVNLSIP